MHDQRGGCTLTCGFLELVGPASVVGHALAVEQRVAAGVEPGVVDEHHHGLALPVLAGVVVPVLLGGIDTVADEHHVAGVNLHLWLAAAGADDHVGAERQLPADIATADGEHGGGVGGGFGHRHVLEPTVTVAGLQADALHLVADVVDRQFLALAAGRTAFEFIRSQGLDQLAEIGGVDVAGKGMRGNGGSRRGNRYLLCLRLAFAGSQGSAHGEAEQEFAGHEGKAPGFECG